MYEHILLPVDLEDEHSWSAALPKAVALARCFEARLTLMTVVPDFGMALVAQYFPQDYQEKVVEEARGRLRGFAREHVPAGVEAETVVAYGRIYEEIMHTARHLGADLIVMASHRPELADYLLGPNAARVVRHAERSVLVVREAG